MKLSNLKTILALSLTGIIALSSCSSEKGLTIEKRKYRGGYHVQWHNGGST